MTGDGVNDAPAPKQAEVGIAVKAATDVAKSRQRHPLAGRAGKIAKTFFTIVFVCTSYLITRQFIVGAFDMILLLIMIDFATLILSTDNVTGPQKPGSSKLKPLVELGFVLGLLKCAESFVWFFIGRRYFPISGIEEMHSFGFAILFYTGIINILVVRAPRRFYRQSIGKVLLFFLLLPTACSASLSSPVEYSVLPHCPRRLPPLHCCISWFAGF